MLLNVLLNGVHLYFLECQVEQKQQINIVPDQLRLQNWLRVRVSGLRFRIQGVRVRV